MSKTPKKQSLLGKTPARKNTTQKNKTRATSQRQAQTKQHTIDTELNDKNNRPHALMAATRSNVMWLIKNAPKPSASSIVFKSQSSSFSMVVSIVQLLKKGAPLW